MEVGVEGDYIYLSVHCHHQNDFCIKMGSDESYFNVSVGSDGQSHKTVSTNHKLFEEIGKAEAVSNRGPSVYQPTALPLGQTGFLFHLTTNTVSYIPTFPATKSPAGAITQTSLFPFSSRLIFISIIKNIPRKL